MPQVISLREVILINTVSSQMQLLDKVSMFFVVLLCSSCTSPGTTKGDAAGELSWVAEARENREKSNRETDLILAQLRNKSRGVEPFADNQTWALYRIEDQVYGVRTEEGKVTGELVSEDAKLVGPWVRARGEFRTGGSEGRYKIQMAVSEGYTDIQ